MCFQDKISAERSIDRFEAHLPAKEFTQIEGVVYAETFSLIVRISLYTFASGHVCPFGFWIIPKGHEDYIPKWTSRRGDLHGQPIDFVSKG